MNLEVLDALNIPPWAIISLVFLLSTSVMYLVKGFLLRRIKKLVSHTTLKIDTILLDALQVPSTILIFLVNILLLEKLLSHYEITNTDLSHFSSIAAQVMLVVAIVLFSDRFSNGALNTYTTKSEALRSSSGIIKGVVRGTVFAVGVLVLLGTLGISITPIIASLGITSLAVALALQPTLENFFSGVQLVMDKPIRVGDFIELDSGEQGFVEKIGWRSTWVKMLPNNVVIMPNSVLSQSKIINYYYPVKELSVPVDVGVHYDSDLEHVERVTLEVAREILISHEWGVDDYNTFVVFHTFDNSSINFTVMLRAKEYFNRFWVKSAFIKALHKRYAEEGIVIPYPIRAINTQQENPEFKVDKSA